MAVEITKKKNPHLAITHKELQGGSANGRNVSLLMKSDVEITEEVAQLIEKISGVKVEVTKASYSAIRDALDKEIRKFDEGQYSWSWVVDFDDANVVFSNDKGMYYTSYSVDGNSVSVGNEATEVSRVVSYVEGDNKIVLSDNLEGLDAGVYSLIVKSFDSISKNEKLVDVFKSKNTKGNKMDEIQKAVDAATSALKEQLEKSQADLKTAVEKAEALEKAAQEQKEAARKEQIAELVKDEAEAEALFKSVQGMEDSAFEVILKALSAKVEQIEKSDLFEKQTEKEEIEKADELPLTTRLLQEKYNKQ